MTEGKKLSPQMMRGCAGFHTNKAWRQGRKDGQHFTAAEFALGHHCSISADCMDLKHPLREIEADNGNILRHGNAP